MILFLTKQLRLILNFIPVIYLKRIIFWRVYRTLKSSKIPFTPSQLSKIQYHSILNQCINNFNLYSLNFEEQNAERVSGIDI